MHKTLPIVKQAHLTHKYMHAAASTHWKEGCVNLPQAAAAAAVAAHVTCGVGVVTLYVP